MWLWSVQAYPENAFDNGVRFLLSNKVIGITTEGGKVKTVQTTGEELETKYIINCVGLYTAGSAQACGFLPDHYWLSVRQNG